MPAADPGKGRVDDRLRGVAHELQRLGWRRASPRLTGLRQGTVAGLHDEAVAASWFAVASGRLAGCVSRDHVASSVKM
jgi:hypothetical protein